MQSSDYSIDYCLESSNPTERSVRARGENENFTDGPQFRHQPISVETQYGATEILQCDVDGNPTPEIRWYHEDSERQVASTPNISVVVNHETAGRYFCKAHVPGFQELMGYANIYIRAPPSIVSQRVQYVPDEGAVKVIFLPLGSNLSFILFTVLPLLSPFSFHEPVRICCRSLNELRLSKVGVDRKNDVLFLHVPGFRRARRFTAWVVTLPCCRGGDS